MQAAIGRVLLRRLAGWVETRRRHAALLCQHLARLPALRLTIPPPSVRHSFYKYYAFLRPERLRPGWSRDRIVRAIQAEGVPCGSGICPEIYREGAFKHPPYAPARRLPVARRLGETSLMFLVHPTLSDGDVLDTCRAVEKVLRVATSGGSTSARRVA